MRAGLAELTLGEKRRASTAPSPPGGKGHGPASPMRRRHTAEQCAVLEDPVLMICAGCSGVGPAAGRCESGVGTSDPGHGHRAAESLDGEHMGSAH